MSNELATVDNRSSALGEVAVTQDQVVLIKNTVAVGATDDELKLFFFECRRRGVHPMDRLIHFVKRQGKATFQCSIDFMRMQAEDTGLYRGQEDVEYGPIGKDGFPEWARAIVKKKDPDTGEVYPNPSTAYWTEFYPGEQLGFMWKKMPRIMLGKVAEAQALRKAFPRQFNNLYTFDEMQQADIVASGTPKGKTPMQAPQEKKEHTIKDPDSPASENQVKAISAMYGKLGFEDNLKYAYCSEAAGLTDVIKSTKDLTKAQASAVIDKLNRDIEEKKAVEG